MSVSIISGYVTEAKEKIIIHQVNCLGIMGSGVALCMKNRYPKNFERYVNICRSNPSTSLLGEVLFTEEKDKVICNMFSQHGIGGEGRNTDYEAFKYGLDLIKVYIEKNELEKRVAVPYKIGCVRGGGDWEVIEDIIQRNLNGYEVNLYRLENKKWNGII